MKELRSEAGNVKTFVLEGYTRFPYYSLNLPHLDSSIHFALEQLCEPPGMDLFDLTCHVKQFDKISRTGDCYLAQNVIKYKVSVVVEAQLIDDVEVTNTPRP